MENILKDKIDYNMCLQGACETGCVETVKALLENPQAMQGIDLVQGYSQADEKGFEEIKKILLKSASNHEKCLMLKLYTEWKDIEQNQRISREFFNPRPPRTVLDHKQKLLLSDVVKGVVKGVVSKSFRTRTRGRKQRMIYQRRCKDAKQKNYQKNQKE